MKNFVKFLNKFVVLLCFCIVTVNFCEYDLFASMTNGMFSEQSLNRRAREREANALVRVGDYDAAIEKYKAILHSDLIIEEDDKMISVGSLTKLYILKKDYDKALFNHQWVVNRAKKNVKKYGFNNGAAESVVKEIMVLKEYQESGNVSNVKEFIDLIKKEDARLLPPNGVSTSTVSRILRLYDTIGDLDGGIEYVTMCLDFFKMKTEEAGKLFNTSIDGFPKEYFLIREAFKKDKAEGTEGRATTALIQSDYFPW